MAFRPDVDPGPMRYVCRADDCRAFGTARLSFTTEEEPICHWNTFHVAVMPQFTCQHPGCGTVFAANPGSLDRYLSHIERRRKAETDAGIPPRQRHSYEADEKALAIKPNPYYKPPGPQDEVPQRMARVIAPPVYCYSGNPGDNVRNIRWAYRIFEKKIRQAMERLAAADNKKRRRSDASFTRPDGAKKRYKSGSSQGGSRCRRESGETSVSSSSSQSSYRNPRPGPSKMPKIQLNIKRCQPPGTGNKTVKMSTSPHKAGRHRRPSTGSGGPSDGSGRQPRVSGQGEVRVIVPKDTDPLRDGPIDRRLTWNEPSQLVLTQPTARPRDQPVWDDLCVATDFETEQLQGEVGTPEKPQFTYEEAAHNWRSGRDLTLYVGEDIIQQGSDELVNRSGPKLKRLRQAVEESRLPLLPQGILPGGWDALGRPWAPMDCPVDQVPQIPSIHGHARVTVAVLVSFPPKPLYFPDLGHMDCAVQVWKKASQRRPVRMSEETHKDGRLKSAGTTYGRLSLPGYRHSIPVPEALKEARWSEFREGRWGNRENPPAPEGDVRPVLMEKTCPTEEQTAAATSESALGQCSVTHHVSPIQVSSRETLSSGTLRIVIPASDVDSLEDEMRVSASPLRLPSSQELSTDPMTEVVTTAVLHRQQAEDQAAASSSSRSQEGKVTVRQSPGIGQDLGPLKTGCPESEEPAETDPTGARPWVGQNAIVPVETHTWEEVEGAVWQSACGTSDEAMGYALAILDRIWADVEQRFRFQTRALQTGHEEGEEFGRKPQMQNLLGRTRYLWERNIALQLQVRALTEEREDLVRRQTTDLETTLGLHNKMAELKQERDQLQQQLEDLRAEPPATVISPASIASEVWRTAREWKVVADSLKADADRIRVERSQLQDRVKELQAAYQQQAKDLTWANCTIDLFQEQLGRLKQTAQLVNPAS